jgi:hypothetical protein
MLLSEFSCVSLFFRYFCINAESIGYTNRLISNFTSRFIIGDSQFHSRKLGYAYTKKVFANVLFICILFGNTFINAGDIASFTYARASLYVFSDSNISLFSFFHFIFFFSTVFSSFSVNLFFSLFSISPFSIGGKGLGIGGFSFFSPIYEYVSQFILF